MLSKLMRNIETFTNYNQKIIPEKTVGRVAYILILVLIIFLTIKYKISDDNLYPLTSDEYMETNKNYKSWGF